MAEKVTMMKLKVDLQCNKCYKKVKRVLCKFPQIRDQVYDQKNNVVTITVVCCNPEKLRDKLCCKGCGTIKSIEIVEPPKPKPPPPEKPKGKAPPPPSRQQPPSPPRDPPSIDKALKKPPPPPPVCPPPLCPPPTIPIGPCYEGWPGGPCFEGYRGPPPTCYGYGRPVYDSYGGGRPCYVSSCGECLYEDNTSVCTIM